MPVEDALCNPVQLMAQVIALILHAFRAFFLIINFAR